MQQFVEVGIVPTAEPNGKIVWKNFRQILEIKSESGFG